MTEVKPVQATEIQAKHPDEWQKAVDFLKEELSVVAPVLRKWIAKDPENWWAKPRHGDPSTGYPGQTFHFSGGMAVRNALRSAGFGDDCFGVNLDDIYISMVEQALKQ